MKKILFSWLLLNLTTAAVAQDTLTAVVYNLLRYAQYTDFCTTSNNNHNTTKNPELRKLIAYLRPDIFAVNELGPNQAHASNILANVMNQEGRDYYARATYTNEAGADLVNMIYYDTRKLGLAEQRVLAGNLRDLNLYRFFYRSPGLTANSDTTYLVCVVAHLKAGQGSSNRAERAAATAALMDQLQERNRTENVLLVGDLNLYTSAEPAYQNLIDEPDPRYRFFDPIERPGTWHNSSPFASVHTQSTRTSGSCHAGGGMDDRFDFILANRAVLDDSVGVRYLPGSYRAVGQDGQRYNGNVNNPPNSDVPADIANALFLISDHLPVLAQFEVSGLPTSLRNPAWTHRLRVPTATSSDQLSITFDAPGGTYFFEVFDLLGRQRVSRALDVGDVTRFELPLHGLPAGYYLLRVRDSRGHQALHRFIRR